MRGLRATTTLALRTVGGVVALRNSVPDAMDRVVSASLSGLYADLLRKSDALNQRFKGARAEDGFSYTVGNRVKK